MLDGLRLRAEGALPRVYDPGEGLLPTARELDAIARAREARLAELEAQLVQLRAQEHTKQ